MSRSGGTPRRAWRGGRSLRTVLIATAVLALGALADGARAVSVPARTQVGSATGSRCLLPGTGRTLSQLWRPDVAAARAYARGREGDITFAVRTPTTVVGYRTGRHEWSASVLKAMLLVAYLDRTPVADRALTPADIDLLTPMIIRSDNDAADAVDTIIGAKGLSRLARRVGMTSFVPVEPVWGESEITAADQTRFFLGIDRDVVPRHRAYAMYLLSHITGSQRWGIGEVAPHGWRLFFKGGWGSGTGLIDNQVALLQRGCARISLAVLSMHDGTHAYGKQTLRGIFVRLLRGLPEAPQRPALR